MSSSAEAPKLKKFVIERSADLSGKTREELAAATQASDQRPLNLAQRRGRLGGAGGETAKERAAACACHHTFLPPLRRHSDNWGYPQPNLHRAPAQRCARWEPTGCNGARALCAKTSE